MTNGSQDTVWFTACTNGVTVTRMNAATGTLTNYAATATYTPLSCTLANINGNLWSAARDANESVPDIVQVTPTGAFTFFDSGAVPVAFNGTSNITLGSDGNLWFGVGSANFATTGTGIVMSMSPTGTPGRSVQLPQAGTCMGQPFGYFPGNVLNGPDGNLYVSAFARRFGGTCHAITAAVFKISTNASILAEFNNVRASSMIVGPDKNLWFIASPPTQIVRMTTSGVMTSYPTPNQDIVGLTAGSDGALWFTDYSANSLGRMTTSGAVTEYPIPFLGAPGSIIACPDPATTVECGPKGGVWFVHASPANAYSIVRFNEP